MEGGGPGIVLDAAALLKLHDCEAVLRRHAGRVVLTPHAGEMATLLDVPREEVQADPLGAARRAAGALGVVVAMKGGCTFVVSPQGAAWWCDQGNVGLATSGSGDTLAGVIAGLIARGATPVDATIWGVFLHGEAGDRLARKRGPVGYPGARIAGGDPVHHGGARRGALATSGGNGRSPRPFCDGRRAGASAARHATAEVPSMPDTNLRPAAPSPRLSSLTSAAGRACRKGSLSRWARPGTGWA